MRLLPGQLLRNIYAFLFSLMSEHGTLHYITDSINIINFCFQMIINRDLSFYSFNTNFVETESIGVWSSANTYQAIISFQLDSFTILCLSLYCYVISLHVNGRHFVAQVKVDT